MNPRNPRERPEFVIAGCAASRREVSRHPGFPYFCRTSSSRIANQHGLLPRIGHNAPIVLDAAHRSGTRGTKVTSCIFGLGRPITPNCMHPRCIVMPKMHCRGIHQCKFHWRRNKTAWRSPDNLYQIQGSSRRRQQVFLRSNLPFAASGSDVRAEG